MLTPPPPPPPPSPAMQHIPQFSIDVRDGMFLESSIKELTSGTLDLAGLPHKILDDAYLLFYLSGSTKKPVTFAEFVAILRLQSAFHDEGQLMSIVDGRHLVRIFKTGGGELNSKFPTIQRETQERFDKRNIAQDSDREIYLRDQLRRAREVGYGQGLPEVTVQLEEDEPRVLYIHENY